MFKCLCVALLSVVLFSDGSLEAQIFRRRFSQPQAQPVQRYNPPAQRYAQPAQRYAQPAQRYVPNNGGTPRVTPRPATTPQDIARQQVGASSQQPASGQPTASPRLEGPQVGAATVQRPQTAESIVQRQQIAPSTVHRQQIAPATGQRPQQMHRRVTVYNTRTGQRSIRLIPIPSPSLAQQPYVYGQSPNAAQAVNAQAVNRSLPATVNGTLNVPAGASVNQPTAANEIRLDSQVTPATFSDPLVNSVQPAVVSNAPVVAPPVVAPPVDVATRSTASDAGQFSVLEFASDANGNSAPADQVELAPPAN